MKTVEIVCMVVQFPSKLCMISEIWMMNQTTYASTLNPRALRLLRYATSKAIFPVISSFEMNSECV